MSKPTAAVLLIGDELLSGRTRDVNLQQIASYLAPLGIPVKECRTVSDEQADIVEAVNALRAKYTYVFTTGGIGPTHDDITADAIATAFGVGIGEHADAIALLSERYKAAGMEFTQARRRMARVPDGATLVSNPVSGAPGFQMGNVFTLAGVPSVARAMLEDIGHRLENGAMVHSASVRGPGAMEGALAEPLGALAEELPDVSLGSYPWFKSRDDHGVILVARGTDGDEIERAALALENLLRQTGVEPERLSEADA
jgi:molybdenum cofactor synthesis domain-containing protein